MFESGRLDNVHAIGSADKLTPTYVAVFLGKLHVPSLMHNGVIVCYLVDFGEACIFPRYNGCSWLFSLPSLTYFYHSLDVVISEGHGRHLHPCEAGIACYQMA